jgi:hypothetical protein
MGDPKREHSSDDGRSDKDFYKEPGGGLIDPQGEPKREDDETTEPTEELPPEGLGKKSPDQDLDNPPRHRGG